MYDQEKFYELLELNFVLEQLASKASLDATKEAAISLRPFPSFGKAPSPNGILTRAEVGAVLTMSELLSISNTLRVIRTVKEWRENISDHSVVYLNELFGLLSPNKFLEDLINTSIKNEEEMYDNASIELAEIRKKIRRESHKIKDKLDSIVKNHSKAKYLQEAIVTQRDGRYVVPVKSEYKNEIPGSLDLGNF